MRSAKELRSKRVAARIPGRLVSQRARVSRGRLSEIECGLVSPSPEELHRINRALTELVEARRRVAQVAAECGWPMAAV